MFDSGSYGFIDYNGEGMYDRNLKIKRINDYVILHLCVIVFSFTGVFTKFAANSYNDRGIANIDFFFFVSLMILDCIFYAFCWQKIIKRFKLSVGYANRSVYLVWSQMWAVLIFGEHLDLRNVVGLFVVLIGVIVVSISDRNY